jgi:hypothetical protein
LTAVFKGDNRKTEERLAANIRGIRGVKSVKTILMLTGVTLGQVSGR